MQEVLVPQGTPLILEGKLFAKAVVDILEQLDVSGTKIKDTTSRVVAEIIGGHNHHFYEDFTDSNGKNEGRVLQTATQNHTVSIEGVGVNAELKVSKGFDGYSY